MVDDEKHYTSTYCEDLQLEGVDVRFVNDVDTALQILETELHTINLVILDLMMPPMKAFEGVDTQHGLRTGVRFYEALRARAPELPVMILTNVNDGKVEDFFRSDKKCWYDRKQDWLPAAYTEHVKRVLGAVTAGSGGSE
jgi:DNA-binding response OmpR family regulator